ncbi:hypothetical protein TRSA_20070 [Treponema saccharophilum]|nr:hypothetical protein TRSA_20070 [Treponema saccharophilum]
MRNSVAPFLEWGRVVFLLSFFLPLALVNARLSLSFVASGCATALRPFGNGGALFFCFRFLDARIGKRAFVVVFRSKRGAQQRCALFGTGRVVFLLSVFLPLALLTRVYCCLPERADAQQRCALLGMRGVVFLLSVFLPLALVKRAFIVVFS